MAKPDWRNPSADADAAPLVPVAERDYLEQDDPIRGQAYVCLSFLTPEESLRNDKEVFMISRFLDDVASDARDTFANAEAALRSAAERAGAPEAAQELLAQADVIAAVAARSSHLWRERDLQERFAGFRRSPALEEEFHARKEFRTTMRGVKVRGVYATDAEAKARVEKLHKSDPRHNIWVGQVGAWLPFSDDADAAGSNVEYAETQLNTLMKSYNENLEARAAEFEERKAGGQKAVAEPGQ